MFRKTATVQITGINSFRKTAQKLETLERRQRSVGTNLLDPELFEAVGSYYDLSTNPRDYLYLTARGVTADVPNNNGDAFPREELWRFTPIKNCFVFQTFINDPLHVNHVASNPKHARGFLLDAHYDASNPRDEFVELIVAVDTTKDAQLAENLESGRAKTFSMGCNAERTQCSICDNVAYSPGDFCDHLKFYRMQHIGGKLVYEKCYGVNFTELSYVPDPADARAQTTGVLYAPQRTAATQKEVPLIEKLGMSPDAIREVVNFYRYNIDTLPEGMITLLANLLL